MTGWNWDGSEERFIHAPEMYGAIWFHEDSLDDCRWNKALSFSVPSDLPSGIYAVRLNADADQDHIPFFVTPAEGSKRRRIAFLVPTVSYIAYANSQVMQNADSMQLMHGAFATLEDIDLEMHDRCGSKDVTGERSPTCPQPQGSNRGAGTRTCPKIVSFRRCLRSLIVRVHPQPLHCRAFVRSDRI